MKIDRIAVIDDHAEMRMMMNEVLTSQGYLVQAYSSAKEALADFPKTCPDIVMTDFHMAELDGPQFLEQLQNRYPQILTIMMTAFGSAETAIEAMKKGAFLYLAKPFRNEELVLLTKRAFEHLVLQRQNKMLQHELSKNDALDLLKGALGEKKNELDMIQVDRPSLEVLEERYIKLILKETHESKEKAARLLGISRRTLYRKERLYGLPTLEAAWTFEQSGTGN